MENRYELTKELRATVAEFLSKYFNYEENLEKLRNEKKIEFTEEEVNSILNLLGSFRLRDVFHIVERFKIEVTTLKPTENEPANNTTEQAG